MQKPVSIPKLAKEMFLSQMSWTIWFVGIILLVSIVRIFLNSGDLDGFYSSGFISSNIYMLVIGIITISFLRYYVENGVTRKNYYYGNVIAAIGLSIILPIIIYLISLVEKFIFDTFTSIQLSEQTLEGIDVDVGGNIIGEIIETVILAPFVSPETNLLLSLALFSLHVFVFYLVGWLIGSSFTRLGVIGGLLSIGVGIALLMVKDSMIRLALDMPILQTTSILNNLPEYLIAPLLVVVILVTLIIIRLLTKRAPVEI